MAVSDLERSMASMGRAAETDTAERLAGKQGRDLAHSHLEIERLRAERQAVVNAWTVEGREPKFHAQAQARLRREWPTLARAVEALVAAQPTDAPDAAVLEGCAAIADVVEGAFGGYVECEACDGLGMVPGEVTGCPTCGGDGVEPHSACAEIPTGRPCPACGGTGEVTECN